MMEKEARETREIERVTNIKRERELHGTDGRYNKQSERERKRERGFTRYRWEIL